MIARVVVQDQTGQWLCFDDPERIVFADAEAAVAGALAQAEQAIRDGYCVAGYIGYEAASGINPVLAVSPDRVGMPLIWLGIFGPPTRFSSLPDLMSRGSFDLTEWICDTDEPSYRAAIQRIKAYIRDGDTYQVNYTVRLRSRFRGQPYALFKQLVDAQKAGCSAYIETADFAICSASPELFFEREGSRILLRPMKGTAPRGLTADGDRLLADALAASEKNRAENVMITDMVRNDIGRIALPGTVLVPELFQIESYPTLHQMTSTVTADTPADFVDTVKALFPCASITGAPKVRTMQIIQALESSPRGVYTGMCGYWMPGHVARFNVAIRTVVIDRSTGAATYGTGGGIVWDSVDQSEYRECFTKADILKQKKRGRFKLIESLRYSVDEGWFLQEAHIARLLASAAYFGYPVCRDTVLRELKRIERACLPGTAYKVRCLIDEDGGIETHYEAIQTDGQPWRVGVDERGSCSGNVFCYHKTTARDFYDEARMRHPDCRDVILTNEHDRVTESCFANVVLEIDNRKITPPQACGLLNGTFRAHLIENGGIEVCEVSLGMLYRACRVWLINSVRKWIPVELVPPSSG